jgi:hypothetical protein
MKQENYKIPFREEFIFWVKSFYIGNISGFNPVELAQ